MNMLVEYAETRTITEIIEEIKWNKYVLDLATSHLHMNEPKDSFEYHTSMTNSEEPVLNFIEQSYTQNLYTV